MSVRIKYGKQDKSLANRLLGAYGGSKSAQKNDEEEFDLADLENPLLDPNDNHDWNHKAQDINQTDV